MTDRAFHGGFGLHCSNALRNRFVLVQTMLLSSKEISSIIANFIILLSSSPNLSMEDTVKVNFSDVLI